MKKRIAALLPAAALSVSLLYGCAANDLSPPQEAPTTTDPPRVADSSRKINEESARIFVLDPNATIEIIPEETPPLGSHPETGQLTKRDAESLAISHAGLTVDEVSFLYTKLVEDAEVPHFEVNFRVGTYEYEITVHPETGEILTFTKTDISG